MGEEEKWLPSAAAAFGALNRELAESGSIDLAAYVEALKLIPTMFDYLGSVFGFAKKDLDEKIKHLLGYCESRKEGSPVTVKGSIVADFDAGVHLAGRNPDAIARPLHRVSNSLKFLNLLLQDLLREGNDDHLRVSAQKAFKGSIEYYLAWPVKKAVAAGLYLLPSREAFLKRIGETEETAREPASKLVLATTPILDHVYGVYSDLGIDL